MWALLRMRDQVLAAPSTIKERSASFPALSMATTRLAETRALAAPSARDLAAPFTMMAARCRSRIQRFQAIPSRAGRAEPGRRVLLALFTAKMERCRSTTARSHLTRQHRRATCLWEHLLPIKQQI